MKSCVQWSLPGVLREVTTEFTVDARSLTKVGGNHTNVRIKNPSGAKTDAYITDTGDGTYRVQYTPYEDGKTLPGGPLRCLPFSPSISHPFSLLHVTCVRRRMAELLAPICFIIY